MARLARLVLPGQLHLVVQRGHNLQPVFVDDEDRAAYLAALQAASRQHGLVVHAYALASEQVWLLVTPPQAPALGRTMQTLGRRYVAAFNRRHRRSGTLWDGRFRAAVLDSEHHLIDAMVFVETRAADGAGSSRAHHLGQRHDSLIGEHPGFWALGNTPFDREGAYRGRLERGLPSALAAQLAAAAHKGWAFGPPAFIQQLARQTARPLAPRPRGRPRKGDGHHGVSR